jgi:hypothetical protein
MVWFLPLYDRGPCRTYYCKQAEKVMCQRGGSAKEWLVGNCAQLRMHMRNKLWLAPEFCRGCGMQHRYLLSSCWVCKIHQIRSIACFSKPMHLATTLTCLEPVEYWNGKQTKLHHRTPSGSRRRSSTYNASQIWYPLRAPCQLLDLTADLRVSCTSSVFSCQETICLATLKFRY